MYLDLTVTSGTKEYNEFQPAGTELFRCIILALLTSRLDQLQIHYMRKYIDVAFCNFNHDEVEYD